MRRVALLVILSVAFRIWIAAAPAHADQSRLIDQRVLPQAKVAVAHRGASAYAPEHTLAAYRLAVAQGADPRHH